MRIFKKAERKDAKRDFLSKLYDVLYDEASEVVKEHNPCRVKNGKCINRDGNFCCDGCDHLGPNGCTTKALWCRVWLCEGCNGWFKSLPGNVDQKTIEDRKMAMEKFKIISHIAREFHLLGARASKEETL